jgi:hypothetical protein
MAVRGIRGGKGRTSGPTGPSGSDSAAKTGGTTFGSKVKVEKTDVTRRASDVAPGAASSVDPVTTRALELARKLRSGEISSKEEATKQLIAEILKEKLRMQSQSLTSRIADALVDDPRLNQALDRLWSTEG